MYDRRPKKAEEAGTSEDQLWYLIDRRKTAEEIVNDVTSEFAEKLAQLIRTDRSRDPKGGR